MPLLLWHYLCMSSVASRRNLGTTFSIGGLVNFLNTSKILLICIVLHPFSHFFLAVSNVLFNRIQGSSLFTWEIYQKTTVFFFSSSFLGIFFWAPIRFERYHFQSGYHLDKLNLLMHKQTFCSKLWKILQNSQKTSAMAASFKLY